MKVKGSVRMGVNFGTKKFGFGCMRLPMTTGTVGMDGTVDIEQVKKMVDLFLSRGFTYFDTAHGYINGKSEMALKAALTSRYPRDKFILTDKLSGYLFKDEAEMRKIFQEQLAAAGVTYFDNCFAHAVTSESYAHYQKCHTFQFLQELKKNGQIKHIGMSFHDKPAVLEQVLTEHPEVEMVQIQFNYNDYEDGGVQSRAVYEMCRKFKKPVLVMEPVKGGALVNLPPAAAGILQDLHGGSNASYAIRFAASFEGIAMVLSGMSSLAQMEDNLSYMEDFQPLSPKERVAVFEVADLLKKENSIGCTACHYCAAGCPKKIMIPELFADLNAKRRYAGDFNSDFYFDVHTTDGHSKPSACIKCRQCERVCPQHLPITDLLQEVAKVFEKPQA